QPQVVVAPPRDHRPAACDTRRPRIRAVSRSPGAGVCSGGALSDCVITPMYAPTRFTSSGRPPWPDLLDAGSSPSPTHTIPCCIASVTKYCSVLNLSPAYVPEFVNPAASLLRHSSFPHFLL